MQRRAFLAIASPATVLAAAPPRAGAPTDLEALNILAARYNEYAEKLQRGVIDLKAWQRVERAWRALQP